MSDKDIDAREVEERVLEALYADGSISQDHSEIADRAQLSTDVLSKHLPQLQEVLGKPIAVFDPRYFEYSYPSYTFIETKNNLERGIEARQSQFEHPGHAMLLGTVLGDIDLIHRRVDPDRLAHTHFAKWAKGRLQYFEQFETYPVFQIARWHGKDITEPLNEDPSMLGNPEYDVIRAIRQDPTLLWKIEQTSNNEEIPLPNVLEEYGQDLTRNVIEELRDDDVLLGAAHTFDVNDSQWSTAIMGLTLGGDRERDETTPRMELTDEHDRVIDQLQDLDTDYLDSFRMPFITSGVGQGWADILIELRIQETHHLDAIAQTLRSIDHVKTTRTYMMASVIFDEPLEVTLPHER